MKDARRIGQYQDNVYVTSAEDLASRVFHTVYMGTANSSSETRERAKNMAKEIGAYHLDVNIDSIVSALTQLFTTITGACS